MPQMMEREFPEAHHVADYKHASDGLKDSAGIVFGDGPAAAPAGGRGGGRRRYLCLMFPRWHIWPRRRELKCDALPAWGPFGITSSPSSAVMPRVVIRPPFRFRLS